MKKKLSVENIIYLFVLAALISIAVFFISKRMELVPASNDTDEVAPAGPLTVPVETVEPVAVPVVKISEIMPRNTSTLISSDGTFPDWIELYNAGETEADLSSFKLTCDGAGIDLEAVTLAPGEYSLVFCPGKLKGEGGTIILKDGEGNETDRAVYEACEKDQCVYWEDGCAVYSEFPSPGYENSDEGYTAFQETLSAKGPLEIYEVMVHNETLLRINNKYFDWVEIKNISNETVNLADYYISDSNSDRLQFQLPAKTLAPGAIYVIYCVGDEELAATFSDYAPFALGADRDKLYISAADGSLCDWAPLKSIPLGGSYGRMDGQNGFFYFEDPTPATTNAGGCRCITETPVSLEEDGVFNDVESVTVSLSGKGDIYYTIGGAVPTASSTLYTGPFEVKQTCVVRAVCIESGKITGDVLSLSYIINENHTMPVVSLVTEPSDWTMVYGSPNRDFERDCTVEYFGEGDDSFSIDCGFKLHGATSKKAQEKKSIKLCFRSRYDGNLEYDLFDNGISDISSIILRAAQEDVYSTLMRDNLMHELSLETFPDLVAQDYKWAVFYVNGQYWGLYTIREAHSANNYAQHKGVDPDSISMYRELINGDCQALNIAYNYIKNHGVASTADYEYVCSLLDVDSIIAWSIIESYSGNYDIHPSNVRFFYNSETGLLSYSLADLDLGMFDQYTWYNTFELGYKYNTVARMLLGNAEYKEKFLTALSTALEGPLSNENVLAKLEAMRQEISPEITRDRARWGSTYERWNEMVDAMVAYINYGSGRAKNLAAGLRTYVSMTDAEFNEYFGNVK